jgi:hypothetical protein
MKHLNISYLQGAAFNFEPAIYLFTKLHGTIYQTTVIYNTRAIRKVTSVYFRQLM